MKIGIMLPFGSSDGPGRLPTWPELRAVASHAEVIGLDSAWVCDHFISGPPGQAPEGIHEGWTILAALAASTQRLELGQLVMCVSFRHPALLAKMAVTADAVSAGRIVLGLGAGWYDPEYQAFGFPIDHRGSRFAEALQVIVPLLRGERVSFTGRYHHLDEAVLMPPPERPIPILVAGHGPRMLRLTARYADAWNTAWYGKPDDRLRHRLETMDTALRAQERDPTSLRRTVGVQISEPDQVDGPPNAIGGDVDDLARALDDYARLGVDDLILLLTPCNESTLDRVARAIDLRG